MALDKMVDSTQLDSDLTSVANAIRAKSGGSGQLAFPSGFVSEIGNIPSGGPNETLLNSGDYTVSSDLGSGNMVIPISVTGTATKIVVVKDSVTSGVAQTFTWFRSYDTLPTQVTNEFSFISELKYVNANGGAGYAAKSTMVPATFYLDSTTNPTKITCARYSNNYQIRADKYHWYVWGEAST